MASNKVEENTKTLRERMLDLSQAKLIPCPTDSPWLRIIRLNYSNDGNKKHWDIMWSQSSVCIVIFNVINKKLVFVKQFRPAYYCSTMSKIENGEIDIEKYPPERGLTLELCAGTVDKDKSLKEIAQDELLEECGYDVPLSDLEEIITYRFTNYKATKQTLFYAEVTDSMRKNSGGGLDDEGELIEVVEMSIDEVKEYLSQDEVCSPASFLNGVTWFLLNKKDRYSSV